MQVCYDGQWQLLMFISSQVLRTRREMVAGWQGGRASKWPLCPIKEGAEGKQWHGVSQYCCVCIVSGENAAFLCLESVEWKLTALQDCSACHHPGNISLRSPLSLSRLSCPRDTSSRSKWLFHSPVPDRGDEPCRNCSFVEKQLKNVLTVCMQHNECLPRQGIFILKWSQTAEATDKDSSKSFITEFSKLLGKIEQGHTISRILDPIYTADKKQGK